MQRSLYSKTEARRIRFRADQLSALDKIEPQTPHARSDKIRYAVDAYIKANTVAAAEQTPRRATPNPPRQPIKARIKAAAIASFKRKKGKR